MRLRVDPSLNGVPKVIGTANVTVSTTVFPSLGGFPYVAIAQWPYCRSVPIGSEFPLSKSRIHHQLPIVFVPVTSNDAAPAKPVAANVPLTFSVNCMKPVCPVNAGFEIVNVSDHPPVDAA